MGAALLDPLTSPLPRLDLITSSFPRVRMIAPASAAAGRREAATLPAFSGLRVSARPRRTLAATRAPVIDKADSRRGLVTCEAQDTAVEVPDVAKETWQSLVMECPRPVVVEFWAPWCGPCRMIHPVMAKVAKEYEGKMDCFKINTDDCPDLAAQYGIRSIPTIMIFKNGEKKDAVIGAVPESTLVSCIQRFLER